MTPDSEVSRVMSSLFGDIRAQQNYQSKIGQRDAAKGETGGAAPSTVPPATLSQERTK